MNPEGPLRSIQRACGGLKGTKVIDATTGQPRRVFHGTPKTFGEFELRQADEGALYGPGIYFTESSDIAGGDKDLFSLGYSATRIPKGDVLGTYASAQAERVLPIVRRKIQENQLTKKQADNLVEFGESNPETANEILLTEGIKNVVESISLDFTASNMKRLEKYVENNEFKSKGEAAANLVLEGLDQVGD